jgi:hypothetical protein
MYVAIDRFEGDLAVLEDEGMRLYPVPRSCLPEDARPGDVLVRNGERYLPAPEETKRRRDNARRLEDQLFGK